MAAHSDVPIYPRGRPVTPAAEGVDGPRPEPALTPNSVFHAPAHAAAPPPVPAGRPRVTPRGDRLRCALLMARGLLTSRQAGAAFGVSHMTACRWLAAFEAEAGTTGDEVRAAIRGRRRH